MGPIELDPDRFLDDEVDLDDWKAEISDINYALDDLTTELFSILNKHNNKAVREAWTKLHDAIDLLQEVL